MSPNPETINHLISIISTLAAAFLVALWISLIIWTYRDASRRVKDRLIPLFASLLVVFLCFPGAIIYLILRPSRTLEEEYQQALEEEALLHSIEESPLCPGCTRKIQNNWVVCPTCHTQLRKPCPKCGRAIELPWDICPYCATSLTTVVSQPPSPENNQPPEKPIFL